ncbi:hypothetical protein FOCC_FOCC006219 [Frankliniella occidentalis]|nr:hypothetical protein FOCC_FOCC006219 [Frankliniella occidentalis]
MAVRERLLIYLEQSQFLIPQQYGFRANTNTETAAADMIIKIQDTLDQNMTSTGICIDLAKAFDTVSHPLLLSKLKRSGLHSNIIEWFSSYLEDRYQYTQVNGVDSGFQKIKYGVPQGSILGPLLFIIFINDINLLKLHGSITLFADDTSLFYFGNDLNILKKQMEDDLHVLSAWLKKNQLFMNYKKTTYMIFNKPSKINSTELRLEINNEEISRVKNATFLGLIIDETLSWDKHINSIIKKIGSLSGVLYRLRNILNKEALKSVYYGLVQSNLTYMSLIWGTATNTRINPLQRLQNRVIKQIFGFHHRHPSIDLYSGLNIMPIRNLINQSSATFAYLVINQKRISQTKFNHNYEVHSYSTRNNDKLRPNISNLTRYGTLAVKSNCVRINNSLPESVRKENKTNKFKTELKKVMLQNPLL